MSHDKHDDVKKKALDDAVQAAHSGDKHDLSNVYKDLQELTHKDGGPNNDHLKHDLQQLSQDLHKQGVLPGVDIVGVDKNGHPKVLDLNDPKAVAKALSDGQFADALQGKSTTGSSTDSSGKPTSYENADTKVTGGGSGQPGKTEITTDGGRTWNVAGSSEVQVQTHAADQIKLGDSSVIQTVDSTGKKVLLDTRTGLTANDPTAPANAGEQSGRTAA